ncbi:MAG: HupE/UreJ family protein [Pseudomonadaceae bacterium]|nr:HupE/UreJ family protein [Pseudomonadaceae bacterium]
MRPIPLVLLALLLPIPAFAHGGTGGGFGAGLWHPVLGLDHLLAMVSVGLLSTQLGRHAILSVPTAFVAAMVAGAILGMNHTATPLTNLDILSLIESGIALSVVLLGFAIALARRMPIWAAMAFVGFFGIFHGFAHGVEIPDLSLTKPYIFGFVCGTAALHLLGVAIGLATERLPHGATILRHMGSLTCGMGLMLVLQLLGL